MLYLHVIQLHVTLQLVCEKYLVSCAGLHDTHSGLGASLTGKSWVCREVQRRAEVQVANHVLDHGLHPLFYLPV